MVSTSASTVSTFPAATGYLALDAGTYDLKVCVSGSDPLACPDAVNPGPLPVEAGTAYTVFAIGSLTGGDGVAALQLLGPIVDATFEAAPGGNGGANATTPPTSTIAPTTEGGSSNGSMLALLGILGIAGLATVGMSRRFATRRVEK